MSEEEKKSIYKLKSIVKVNNDFLKNVENQTINQEEIKAVKIILDLIEKQQKEIEGLNNLIGYMIGVSNGMDKEIVKMKNENKILKNVFNQIRDLTIHYIVWYDYNSKNYNLKGCSKQEIYKNFGRIREIVYAHYCNMNNEKALESLIDDKLKEE